MVLSLQSWCFMSLTPFVTTEATSQPLVGREKGTQGKGHMGNAAEP